MYSIDEYRSPDPLYEIDPLAAREFGRRRIASDLGPAAGGVRARLWLALQRLMRLARRGPGLLKRPILGRATW